MARNEYNKRRWPFKHTRDRRGYCTAKMEDLWDGAIEWAKLHGYEYVPSYGIQGVAPT